MKHPVTLYAAGVLLFVSGGLAEVQAASGNLMEVTISSTLHASGMNAAPHTTRHTSCVSTTRPDARAMFEDMGCTVTNYKQVGDDVSGRVTCPGPPPMSGEGHYTWSGGKFHGQMHMTGMANGQTMSADNTVDGRQVGSCDYKPH